MHSRIVASSTHKQKERKTGTGTDTAAVEKKEYKKWTATEEEIDLGYDYLLDNLPEQDDRLAQQRWLLKKSVTLNSPIAGWPKGYSDVVLNEMEPENGRGVPNINFEMAE